MAAVPWVSQTEFGIRSVCLYTSCLDDLSIASDIVYWPYEKNTIKQSFKMLTYTPAM